MNFANHNQHGVDREKYYIMALVEERKREAQVQSGQSGKIAEESQEDTAANKESE